jgi:hypothetical protein
MRTAGLLLLLATGCTQASQPGPSAVPIIAPDGVAALHVSCGAREGRCYELAGRYCPTGYDIEPTRGPPGNYVVHCRARAWSAASDYPLAPSPYAIQETVQPWPSGEGLAPSPYRRNPPPASGYPPLAPGGPPNNEERDLGF